MDPEHRPEPLNASVRGRMQQQARRDTAPEMALRRELHRRGLRFPVTMKVPGIARRTIDVAFPKQQLAIFVDGCYWHRCPVHSIPPKNNATWWKTKLDANVARDSETTKMLTERGWRVLRVWEHEEPREVADAVAAMLGRSSSNPMP